MELKEVKALIDLVTKNGLSEFELEEGNFKVRIKKGNGEPILYAMPAPAAPMPVTVGVVAEPVSSAPAAGGKEIVSPMVGTFYRSPSPDSPSFVEVGQQVTEDTVVCIIEAMKVMNEIKSEVRGTITEILSENGKAVEFGKPLFRVK